MESQLYRNALLEDVLPFWDKYSVDHECGGYFTCLNRDGEVFDSDKFIWLQARQAWMYASLYNRLEQRPEWLDMATHGIHFLRKYGMDKEGNWYFALSANGVPLIQPYNIFSDCFAAMAFSQFARAAGDTDAKSIAEKTYLNILRRKENPRGIYTKEVPGSRPMISLAIPMILANVTMELDWQLEKSLQESTIDMCIRDVFSLCLDKEKGILHEAAAPDGTPVDSFAGRVTIPGHGIEAMWFFMDIAEQRKDKSLIQQAVDIVLRTLEFGWDEKYGGIFYFLDIDGKPPEQLEWDQKLWWAHLETLISLLKGYRLTGDERCIEWCRKVHDYSWDHFPDPKYGEWYGYLNRRGEVLLPLKGGKWKGCFHVPRGLYLCMRELEKLDM